MPKQATANVGGVVLMTPEERSEHIAYYRERMQELQQMGRWIAPSEAAARAAISTRLIALERTLALLQDSASWTGLGAVTLRGRPPPAGS